MKEYFCYPIETTHFAPKHYLDMFYNLEQAKLWSFYYEEANGPIKIVIDVDTGNCYIVEDKEYYMEYTLRKAIALAKLAHKDQQRWFGEPLGEPYVTHLEAVADQFNCLTLKTIAWLHDIVEDTSVSIDDLRDGYQFPENVVLAVEALTKRDGEEYDEYIQRVSANTLASTVKIADIEHNLSSGADKKKDKRGKYRLALLFLRTHAKK